MTSETSGTDGECARATLSALEWLDRTDLSPVAASAAFDVLVDRRRRVTLRVLREYGEEMTLADLAEEVAVRELEVAITEVSPETVTEVYISLYHDHLPRLVDAGLLAYEQERDLVSPRASSTAVD